MDENLLGVEKFAHKVNLSPSRIRQLCREKKIEGARKLTDRSRKWMIPASAVQKMGCQTEASMPDAEPHDERILPSLHLSISSQYITDRGSRAILLAVANVSDELIQGVYGKLIASKAIPDGRGRYISTEPITPIQDNLAWQGGGVLKTIAVGSSCNLIVAKKLYEYPGFTIVFETSKGDKQVEMLSLLLTVEIGSEVIGLRSQTAQIELFWGFSGALEGKLIDSASTSQTKDGAVDTGPQLPPELVSKDQEEHWEAVRSHLMALEQPISDVDDGNQVFYINLSFKDEIIAEVIRSHVPDTVLWHNVNSYNEEANKANSIRKELAEEIRKSAMELAPWESECNYQEKYVTPYFITSVIDLSLGRVISFIRRYAWDEVNRVQKCQARNISAGIQSEREHRELVEIYSKDDRVKSLKETTMELESLKGRILTRLQTAINDKEYKYTFCSSCPLVRARHTKL